MAFKFKRTIPVEQVPVALSAREWEVVRKALRNALLNDPNLMDLNLYTEIGLASTGEFLDNLKDYASFIKDGVNLGEEEVKVGDEVLWNGIWAPVVAVARNGKEISVDTGDGGLYVVTQSGVDDHRPAKQVDLPQPVPKYVPKVGDRVRAKSTRNSVPETVVGKVGVVEWGSDSGLMRVRYTGAIVGRWYLDDFEPAQIVGKEYISSDPRFVGTCTLIRNEGDIIPLIRRKDGIEMYVYDYDLIPA
ncbi:hypothetical protein UFOVP60_21 [uncultured Caudovirales phage]|uniref:Uncharacterized protein n=1 Tax=uncultured Caudovirales phage TaxID=2100421 RepID=A0A6J5TCP7_9CAUD|nr:hypothetical protein UFOVP60_21 [uncultured Caudovirales phage]